MASQLTPTGALSSADTCTTNVLRAYTLMSLMAQVGQGVGSVPLFCEPGAVDSQPPLELGVAGTLLLELQPVRPVVMLPSGILVTLPELTRSGSEAGEESAEAVGVRGAVDAPPGRDLAGLRLRRANRSGVVRVPACLDKLLPAEHLARRVSAVVEGWDLSEFYVDIQVTEHSPGAPATDPQILVELWLYASLEGEDSARRIANLCVEHLAYVWICGGVAVNYHTLSDFRVQHGEALDHLLTQMVKAMLAAGLVEFDTQSQDGMRVRASAGAASFHREATLNKALAAARLKVEACEQAMATDTSSLTPRQQAAQERAAREQVERLETALAELPAVKAAKPADEREQARVSSTDPEARVMKMADGGFRPAYNWEFATDAAHLVITGVDVVNIGSDKGQALPMLAQLKRRYGRLPKRWLIDGGFVSLGVIQGMAEQQVEAYAPVPEPKDKTRDPFVPLPTDPPGVAEWRERMGTQAAKTLYPLRAASAECVNAQARNSHGVHQVRVRGRAKVRCVALWVALAHNLSIWLKHQYPSAVKRTVQPIIEVE